MSSQGWPYLLVPFIPIAIVLELAHAGAVVTFFASALGVIPTAALMGRATEELAVRSGPGIGGLLNVTFGNAPELIIALFALNAGLHEVVKASIVGSIMGNVLLVLGAAMFFGGLKRDRQFFNRTAATAQSSMLLLAAAASSCRRSTSSSTAAACRSPATRPCTTTPRSSGSLPWWPVC
jgi:Ca2+:H+ antiporter